MIDLTDVSTFLAGHRIVVVGASDDPKSFGWTIFRELRSHGYDAVPVNRGTATVDGVTCHPTLDAVPDPIDGVVVMVNRDAAADVVRACIDRGVTRIWLFKGIGAPGAVSDEAVALCRDHGIDVVEGACPLMFLEPVGWAHRLHRGIRRMNRSLVPS